MNPLTLFTSPQSLLILALVWVLSLGAVGYKAYGMGEDHVNSKLAEQKELIAQAVTQAGGELGLQYQAIMTSYLKDNLIVREIHDKTIVKVPTYITKEADAKCTINKGFVELHNSAAEVRDLKPADATLMDNSGVLLSDVAGVVVSNYSKCEQNARQLVALQAEVVAYQEKITELNSKLKGKK